MKKIRNKCLIISGLIIIILMCITSTSASQDINHTLEDFEENTISKNNTQTPINQKDISSDLESKIINAKDGDEILIEPGTYKIHNIELKKSITLQGNGNPRDIVLDGEEKSSIFLIRNSGVHVTFKNISFINGLTHNFGGAISNEKGYITVDNCIFINNTALDDTNAGGISNYGTKKERGYLFVNNSLFLNNHADHDGGAITTCYADSYIYNCVFINNTAVRDGGAIRVSVFGYGDVQDCIFMFNHADEWGGAYYSWSGESNIERCIFMNNTAGTNGGAVMVSGNINLQDSIIVNNNGGETGGSFYIQQPMYDKETVINVHNNIITNNSSPKGKEIFIKWDDVYNLYTKFDDNDWGEEDPNDSSVNDPNNVTSRSKVSRTIKSNLFNRLNIDLLDNYMDLIGDYFTEDSYNDLKDKFKKEENTTEKENNNQNKKVKTNYKNQNLKNNKNLNTNTTKNCLNTHTESETKLITSNTQFIIGNSTSYGEDEKAYELNKTGSSVTKQANIDYKFFIVMVLVLILLAIGYKRYKKEE